MHHPKHKGSVRADCVSSWAHQAACAVLCCCRRGVPGLHDWQLQGRQLHWRLTLHRKFLAVLFGPVSATDAVVRSVADSYIMERRGPRLASRQGTVLTISGHLDSHVNC